MGSQESGKFPVVIGREFTPHIASVIFNLLDKQELRKSRSVSSVWKDVVDSRTDLWNDPQLYGEAAWEGNIEICRLFLDHSEDKNPKEDQYGSTPLHSAARAGNPEGEEIYRLIMNEVEIPKIRGGAHHFTMLQDTETLRSVN